MIVAAGLDAALPSVVGGLAPGLVIAVPTSTGYGIAEGGITALRSMLVSCAPASSSSISTMVTARPAPRCARCPRSRHDGGRRLTAGENAPGESTLRSASTKK